MQKDSRIACFDLSLFKALAFSAAVVAFICLLDSPPKLVLAQKTGDRDTAETRAFAPAAINHAQQMRIHKDTDNGSQSTPGVIPKFSVDPDPTGQIATFQPGGATSTGSNAFFQDLGTNGRSCFTCHQPQNGWTISAAGAQARFEASSGGDPLFRLVDGATCPTAKVSTPGAKRQAYKLLIEKGLIRIGLPLPQAPNLQFEVTSVDDPYNCTTNPATGLTDKTTGIVSVYRRPLPSTNLGFLTAIMWDGREPSLASQSIDATLIHAQASAAPTGDQQGQIVAFESGVFTAQIFDNKARDLDADGASGGPVALSLEIAKFFVGVNDPVGLNPKGLPFDPNIFDLYTSPMWSGFKPDDEDENQVHTVRMADHRRSIARGERLFNTTQINITGVAGLNDALNLPSIAGFCGTCHDTPDVGNHSVKAPLNIGIANAGANKPPALDISGLPIFTLKCTKGPLAGQIFVVTDPGRALISGNCADIGKVKGPILRGLAARAPYFHNGSAATLLDAVNFYDQRFGIGFTAEQKKDLVNFLNAL
jgi:cytochrome c peroxidase